MEKLGTCTTACLNLAVKLCLFSIAFPAISTGIYCVPYAIAAQGMFNAILTYCRTHPGGQINEIRLVLYEKQAMEIFLGEKARLTS
jgi:O-acetyl-ADP-ribose deacetylase (regulator of RNase III)